MNAAAACRNHAMTKLKIAGLAVLTLFCLMAAGSFKSYTTAVLNNSTALDIPRYY